MNDQAITRLVIISAFPLLAHAILPSTAIALELDEQTKPPRPGLTMRLHNTTQGPLWPPSALTDENGDFIVIGNLLRDQEGQVVLSPGQAAIVSKDTIPPLNNDGVEDFSNPFGAPYKILRMIDLRAGSPDRNLVLNTNSYGPAIGSFGGGPRIPREGDSRYNLNGFHLNGQNCPELFPAASQSQTYTRPSFGLHEAPVWGFQGDGVAYDVDTGQQYEPRLKNGSNCLPDGCPGEDSFHTRRAEPITLGEWLKADVRMKVGLTHYDRARAGFTGARFEVTARKLLPNSIYTVVLTRSSFLAPNPLAKMPHPATISAHIISDERGSGRVSFSLPNPFPDPTLDDSRMRVVGVALGYKSDFALHGGCTLRFGAGVDIHAVASTAAAGAFDFSDLVTIEP